MAAQPKLSVLMGVYNVAGRSVPGVESVLDQTFADFEFLIVDDGSTDETPAILDEYARRDDRIRVLRREQNLGLAAALNYGIGQARSPIVARMDFDDWIPPHRLETQHAFLARHPQVDVVSCNYVRQFQDTGASVVMTLPERHDQIVRRLSFYSSICHAAAAIRTAAFYRAGFYNPSFRRAQDYELWLRWRGKARFHNLQEVLFTNITVSTAPWGTGLAGVVRAYRYDLLARSINWPASPHKLLDLAGAVRAQVFYASVAARMRLRSAAGTDRRKTED